MRKRAELPGRRRAGDAADAADGSTVPRTTGPGGSDYDFMSGTSMAAPHMAGLAALMYSANGNLTPTGVMARLKAAAVDKGDAG